MFMCSVLCGIMIVQAPVTQHVVLSVDAPRDLPARIVDTDADVTMSLGEKGALARI